MNPISLALDHATLMLSTDKTWRETAKWSGTVLISSSAAIVALSIDMSLAPAPFFGFLAGHLIWGASAWAMRERALYVLNWGFIPFDIYAILLRI